jgi:hypothetical protein
MKRLQNFFGKAAFTPEKMERIWHYCEFLNNHEFNQVCLGFMDNDQKPGVSDFRAKAKAYKTYDSPTYETKPPECKYCWGVGIVAIKDASGESLAMKCKCGADDFYPLPVYSTDFKMIPPETTFKEMKNLNLANLQSNDLVKRWSKFIKKSIEHWGVE